MKRIESNDGFDIHKINEELTLEINYVGSDLALFVKDLEGNAIPVTKDDLADIYDQHEGSGSE